MSKCKSSLQMMLSNQKRIIFIYTLTAILDLVKNVCIKFSHWANLANELDSIVSNFEINI